MEHTLEIHYKDHNGKPFQLGTIAALYVSTVPGFNHVIVNRELDAEQVQRVVREMEAHHKESAGEIRMILIEDLQQLAEKEKATSHKESSAE